MLAFVRARWFRFSRTRSRQKAPREGLPMSERGGPQARHCTRGERTLAFFYYGVALLGGEDTHITYRYDSSINIARSSGLGYQASVRHAWLGGRIITLRGHSCHALMHALVVILYHSRSYVSCTAYDSCRQLIPTTFCVPSIEYNRSPALFVTPPG